MAGMEQKLEHKAKHCFLSIGCKKELLLGAWGKGMGYVSYSGGILLWRSGLGSEIKDVSYLGGSLLVSSGLGSGIKDVSYLGSILWFRVS